MSEPSKEAVNAAALVVRVMDGVRASREHMLALALDAFAKRAVEAEREACAAICEGQKTRSLEDGAPIMANMDVVMPRLAAAIRERGKA